MWKAQRHWFLRCEQLDWKAPDNIIIPMGSGALLCSVARGLRQFKDIDELKTKVIGAQPQGCSPIVTAFKSNSDEVTPIETPKTIAESLAIGDPGDGVYALKAIRESRGVAESATDEEIIDSIKLLARTDGIFAEPAGGITIAVLRKLIKSGQIPRDEEVVCCVTGNGFKSSETILKTIPKLVEIKPTVEELKKQLKREMKFGKG